jgi:hypothetical protein
MTVVAACRDGQETVERLAQARPDVVVVTDLVMPRLGGSPQPHLSATTTPNCLSWSSPRHPTASPPQPLPPPAPRRCWPRISTTPTSSPPIRAAAPAGPRPDLTWPEPARPCTGNGSLWGSQLAMVDTEVGNPPPPRTFDTYEDISLRWACCDPRGLAQGSAPVLAGLPD